MSGSNCCFLTCIQISQEAGEVVWYSHLLWIFQFVVIHTVKGFSIVNEADIDVFWKLSCFFDGPTDVGTLISGSSAFSKSSLHIWKFRVHCWSLAWRIWGITLLFQVKWVQLCGSLSIVWHCLSLGLESWPFPVLCHCWVFQICWHVECNTFTASCFRIWNSSTGILSPALALFMMLPKAHLTSHSRISGSRWVITPSWLSGSWRSFLYSSSVHSCHLFLISFASVRSIPLLSLLCPSFHEKFPWYL